ncbi:hypothetical protein ETB97_002989 [Aspergillus alliaceus]|uniref:Uncharacterized protein n=1 Tax=Petromyces alliaceus TaxID=209559 RepID=A0A8H6A0N5_PETAA|nr:hypothetical protein ETB97_002989 [Aspergillus burnettii]
MASLSDRKFFVLDFMKTNDGYEPTGFPLQLSEASHIIKMIFAEEGISVPQSSPFSEVVFFEDSVLMQTIACIMQFATKNYAYVKSYNDKTYQGYHTVLVSADNHHSCNIGTVPPFLPSTCSPMGPQALFVHDACNPQGTMLMHLDETSDDYIKDLSDACERYSLHTSLLNMDILSRQRSNSDLFNQDLQPAPLTASSYPNQLAYKDNPDNPTTIRPIPTIEGLHDPEFPYTTDILSVRTLSTDDLNTEMAGFKPTHNRIYSSILESNEHLHSRTSGVKPENDNVTVTLRDVMLHTPKNTSYPNGFGLLTPRSGDNYVSCSEGA